MLPLAIALHLPAIVDHDVLIAGVLHAGLDHGIGHLPDQVFAHMASEFVPAVPSHRRSCGQRLLLRAIEAKVRPVNPTLRPEFWLLLTCVDVLPDCFRSAETRTADPRRGGCPHPPSRAKPGRVLVLCAAKNPGEPCSPARVLSAVEGGRPGLRGSEPGLRVCECHGLPVLALGQHHTIQVIASLGQ